MSENVEHSIIRHFTSSANTDSTAASVVSGGTLQACHKVASWICDGERSRAKGMFGGFAWKLRVAEGRNKQKTVLSYALAASSIGLVVRTQPYSVSALWLPNLDPFAPLFHPHALVTAVIQSNAVSPLSSTSPPHLLLSDQLLFFRLSPCSCERRLPKRAWVRTRGCLSRGKTSWVRDPLDTRDEAKGSTVSSTFGNGTRS